MLSRIFSIGILIILIISYSCTERMDLEPKDLAVYLSVEATLTNETKAHTVKLTRTKLIMDTLVPPIVDAKVAISDGENEVLLSESTQVPGLYLTPENYTGIPGKEYTLKISNVDVDANGDIETYIAMAKMPSELILDSVTAEPFELKIFDFSGWSLKCWAWDPPEENYYLFKAWKNDTLVTDTLYEYNFADDAFFNGQYTNGIECAILNNDKTDEVVRDGDTLTLELCNISKEFYDYLIGAIIESNPKVPMFSGPPANVPSNISGNAVGFFRVYSTVKSSDIAQLNQENE